MKYLALLVMNSLPFCVYSQVTNTPAVLKANNIEWVINDTDSSRYNTNGQLIYKRYDDTLYGIHFVETFAYNKAARRTLSIKSDGGTLADSCTYNEYNQLMEEKIYGLEDNKLYTDYKYQYNVKQVYITGLNNDTSICNRQYDKHKRLITTITEQHLHDSLHNHLRETFSYYKWPSTIIKEHRKYFPTRIGHPPVLFQSLKTSADSLIIEDNIYAATVDNPLVSQTITTRRTDSVQVMQYDGARRLLARNVTYFRADGLIEKTMYYDLHRAERLDKIIRYRYINRP